MASNKTQSTKLSQKRRKGTRNVGTDYEVHLPALFCLKLLEDPAVIDFELQNNVDNFGCLDDLILKISKHDGNENYAFQFKHKETQNLNLKANNLESRGGFGIVKYCEDFCQIPNRDNYHYIIYTNAYLTPETTDKLRNFGITENDIGPGKKYFFEPSYERKKAAKVYKFSTNQKTGNMGSKSVTKDDFKNFFQKFSFYTSQKDYLEVENSIKEKYQQLFQADADSYIRFFRLWKNQEFTTMTMKKSDLERKILELNLTHSISIPHGEFLTNNKSKFELLDKAFRRFDFVLVDDLNEENFFEIIANPHFEEDEDFIHMAQDLKLLTKDARKTVRPSEELLNIKYKTGYFKKETPIVVNVHEKNTITVARTVIKLKTREDKLHFVLRGGRITRDQLAGFKVLQTLYDLKTEEVELYNEILKCLKIVMMEKEYLYVELFSGDEIAKEVTIKTIFEMLSGSFQLTVKEEVLSIPYIPRFLSTTLIKTNFISECGNDNLIVISKVGSTNPKLNQSANIILYQDELSALEFNNICTTNTSKNIHHLVIHNQEYLEWKSTKGHIKNLKKFDVVRSNYTEESIVHQMCHNQINVIVASLGMGKSEILKKLRATCPKDFFPIFVNLKEHKSILKTLTSDQVLHYFVGNDPNKLLLKAKQNFAQQKKIIFYFDGLNELHLDDVNAIFRHIVTLATDGFKIWLSSSPHLEEAIENELNVFCMDIQPFTPDDQKNYITKRFPNSQDIDVIISDIFKNLEKIHEDKDILNIPLQLFMITEILSVENISSSFNLIQMFRQFFEGRYRHYMKKNKCNNNWNVLETLIKDDISYRKRQYQIAALKSCLDTKNFRSLNLKLDESFCESLQAKGDFLGILNVEKNLVNFHHNVFGTFFAALWFAENFNTCKDLLKKILFEDESVVLRLFFDMLLAEECPNHIAIMYRNIAGVGDDVHGVDKGGRTTLHLACSHTCIYSVKSMSMGRLKTIRNIEEESRQVLNSLLDKEVDLSKTDSVFGWTWLEFSLRTSLLPVDVILGRGEVVDLKVLKNHVWDVLQYSAIFSYPNLFKSFFPNARLKPEQISYLLQAATVSNNCEIVEILLDHDATTITHVRTILHLAASKDNTKLVTLLIAKGADVNAVDEFGKTPLHLAKLKRHMNVVKVLIAAKQRQHCYDKS